MKNIAVIGIGYVGLANAISLAKSNNVFCYDINHQKLDLLAKNISPINDENIQKYLNENTLNLKVKYSLKQAVENADILIISTPTDYDDKTNSFDTNSIQKVIKESLTYNSNLIIVIRSTIPVGFTKEMVKQFSYENIYFVPEFLKEDTALFDSLNPNRIIVGIANKTSKTVQNATLICDLLEKSAQKANIKTFIISSDEAEASKLFANAYLAMRVAFFNELDSYAETNNLSSFNIIKSMANDPRIGDFYNNPSFGYGGYCLPKDSKQLKASFGDVPNNQISAIVDANKTRKNFIANSILNRVKNMSNPVIGIYRLTMKKNSSNYRNSSILDVIEILKEHNLILIIYEPLIKDDNYKETPIINDLKKFKSQSDIIISNRYDEELSDIQDKLYTRDLFNAN